MPLTGFYPAVPASQRPQIHALDRAATGIGEPGLASKNSTDAGFRRICALRAFLLFPFELLFQSIVTTETLRQQQYNSAKQKVPICVTPYTLLLLGLTWKVVFSFNVSLATCLMYHVRHKFPSQM
jgi:hypothetical protein